MAYKSSSLYERINGQSRCLNCSNFKPFACNFQYITILFQCLHIAQALIRNISNLSIYQNSIWETNSNEQLYHSEF